MANKKITDVDIVSTINDADYLFINQNSTLKQIQKTNAIKDVKIDSTLSVSGQAADAKITGDKITALKGDIEQLKQNGTGTGGLSTEAIDKLEEVGNYLAYTTADGGSKWKELISMLRNGSSGGNSGETEATLSSISAIYSGGEIVVGTSLNDLAGITVTATYSDGSTENITGYTLSGEIVEGENTITVSYGGKTTTFRVVGIMESAKSLYTLESVDKFEVFDRYNNTANPGYITITNGNHVKIDSETGSGSIWYLNMNISSLATNGQDATVLTDTWFTVPADANLELKLSNIANTNVSSETWCGIRIMDGTSLISVDLKDLTGTEKTVTKTTTAETAVSCMQMSTMLNNNCVLEFDVEFWVNGERWI